jgi:signal transduction histidine kinase
MTERLSILVADDEDIIRLKVSMMLRDAFDVQQAETAAAARKAAANGYDAVLLDIVFPDGNGIDICREIKQTDPHSTVIISSSMESVDAWNEAFQAGADGYLEKRELLALDPRKIGLMIHNLVERNHLRRQAEELSRRQTELLSVLSHDVRAPFQTLLGTIELLRKSSIPNEAADSVETLYQCAKDQLAFINSLLELLRLESGAVAFRYSAADLNLMVNQCLQGLRMLAAAKDILLESDLACGLPAVRADMGQICRLINNLVTNAIKFTPRGGRVSVTTMCSKRNGAAGVELSVSDTGVGISPGDREKIFQRFRTGRDRGTDGELGTGLGLSICREIAQLHDGTLGVESEKGKGSCFRAWLPAEMGEGSIAAGKACAVP